MQVEQHSLRPGSAQHAPTFNPLPPPLFNTTAGNNGPPLTRLDFTDPSGAWKAHVSEDAWVGWEWLVARKQSAG